MGNESSTVKDKRELRKAHRDAFVKAIERWRRRAEDRIEWTSQGGLEENLTNVHTMLRIRPLFPHEARAKEFEVIDVIPRTSKIVVHRCCMHADLVRKHIQRHFYTCDHVFEAKDNDNTVYMRLRPLVAHAYNGGMSTVFCFGQTGSGKTHTTKALAVRAACDLFELAHVKKVSQPVIRFSSFEILGANITDLQELDNTAVKIMEDENKDTHVRNISVVRTTNAADLSRHVAQAFENRKTAETIHKASSRSHAILCFQVGNSDTSGKLLLLDLAGSERNKDTKNHSSQRRTESKSIQSSILALKKCLRAMKTNSQRIPFRESKLTQVLKGSFVDPDAKVAVIATVSPCSGDAEHSISTLNIVKDLNKKTRRRGEIDLEQHPKDTRKLRK